MTGASPKRLAPALLHYNAMKYDAIFFDLDGTVADSLQDIADAINHTMRHFRLPEYTARQLRPKLGWGVGHVMKALLPQATEAFRQELLAHYKPYYALHAADRTVPFEGIPETLRRLRDMGLTLAIISNKPDAAVQPIARRFFDGLVDLAVGELDGVRRKPWPDMLQNAADRLGVALPRCLYVGDTQVDIDTGKNAGIDCVCVTWGFRTREELIEAGAQYIIDRPEQLVEFVEGT